MEKQETVFGMIGCALLGLSIYMVWMPWGFFAWLQVIGMLAGVLFGMILLGRLLAYLFCSPPVADKTLAVKNNTPVVHSWVGHPFADLEEVADKMSEIQPGIRLLSKDLNKVASLMYFGWTIIGVENGDQGRQDFYMQRKAEGMVLSFVDLNVG